MSTRSEISRTIAKRSCFAFCSRTVSSSRDLSKWSSIARLPRPVMIRMSSMPEATASSTMYWIVGLSTMGSISLGWAFVAGKKRVPKPAAGITALRTLCMPRGTPPYMGARPRIRPIVCPSARVEFDDQLNLYGNGDFLAFRQTDEASASGLDIPFQVRGHLGARLEGSPHDVQIAALLAQRHGVARVDLVGRNVYLPTVQGDVAVGHELSGLM